MSRLISTSLLLLIAVLLLPAAFSMAYLVTKGLTFLLGWLSGCDVLVRWVYLLPYFLERPQ